jgi:hypothetical protein
MKIFLILYHICVNSASHYDPKLLKKEEEALEKKRLLLEKEDEEVEVFKSFTKDETKEIEKLDILTKIYLWLRKYITNPIVSLDEVDIKFAVKDFHSGALH